MDGPVPDGARAFLYWSTREATPGNACGLAIPDGQLLIDPTGIFRRWRNPLPHADGTPDQFTFKLPLDPTLVDRKFYAQGFYWDLSGFVLSDGYSMEVGAP
jgi:hypothetical protein